MFVVVRGHRHAATRPRSQDHRRHQCPGWPDRRDRRRTPITLTSAGTDLLNQISPLDDESVLVKSLHLLGDEQSQQLLRLLSQFVMHLSDDEELQAFCRSLQGVSAEER